MREGELKLCHFIIYTFLFVEILVPYRNKKRHKIGKIILQKIFENILFSCFKIYR